jgi:penicillin-binding protein 1A
MRNTARNHGKTGRASPRRLVRWLIAFAGFCAITAVGGLAGVIGAYYFVAPSLPAAETIRDIPLQVPLRIFSRDGYLISEIGERRRIPIVFEDVPEHVIDAFIAAEDQRFFAHPGIDYRGILRAFTQLLLTGEVSSGGSTLTQQLARSYFLSLEQTLERKFKEASLALRIEQEFTKEQIMELFLNKMFFGQRAYGVAAASQVYFNKSLSELNIAEAATLAGVLPAPSRYNPVTSPKNATVRRGYVLGRMEDLDYISESEYDLAMALPMQSRLHGCHHARLALTESRRLCVEKRPSRVCAPSRVSRSAGHRGVAGRHPRDAVCRLADPDSSAARSVRSRRAICCNRYGPERGQ